MQNFYTVQLRSQKFVYGVFQQTEILYCKLNNFFMEFI